MKCFQIDFHKSDGTIWQCIAQNGSAGLEYVRLSISSNTFEIREGKIVRAAICLKPGEMITMKYGTATGNSGS